MAFTIKLQSPSYDNDGTGEEIPLPVSVATYGGNSLAAIITLFQGENVIMDFGQLREVVRVTGSVGHKSATDAGFDNPIHFRDILRRTRSVWPLEAASGNWGSGTLPSGEQDSGTDRLRGKTRLIFDKVWDTGSQSYKNFNLYGTVSDFTTPNVAAASFRDKIPFGLTFFVGRVSSVES